MRLLHIGFGVALLSLGACSQISHRDGAPDYYKDISRIPDAVPKVEPSTKSGNSASYEVFGKRYYTLKSSQGYREKGLASWYGNKFHGKDTASGEPYDVYGMTAAHRALPLPTYARVTNLENKQSVIVKINDRGPFYSDRLIDLSYAAAKKLGIVQKGTGFVEVEALDPLKFRPQYHTQAPNLERYADELKVYIQLGAFQDKTKAESLQRDIARVAKTVIQPSYQGSQLLYKVRVGPFHETTEAESLKRKHLANSHIRRGMIVID